MQPYAVASVASRSLRRCLRAKGTRGRRLDEVIFHHDGRYLTRYLTTAIDRRQFKFCSWRSPFSGRHSCSFSSTSTSNDPRPSSAWSAVAVEEELLSDSLGEDESQCVPSDDEDPIPENANDTHDNSNDPNISDKNKKALKLRRVAVHSIPMWLKREPQCFERVVKALNLNTEAAVRWASLAASSSKTSPTADLPAQYRKAYADSIPSFINYLYEENLPLQLENALNRLVAAGFGDPSFAENYKSVKKYQILFAQTTAQLEQKRQSLHERQATVQDINTVIADLQQELQQAKELLEQRDPDESTDQEEKGKDDTSGGVMGSLFSLMKHDDQTSAAEKLAVERKARAHEEKMLQQKIQRLERQIEGRMKFVHSHETSCANTQEMIDRLVEQQNAVRSPMSIEEYDSASVVVKEVLAVLCDALAIHVQQQHSKLIGQYQVLDARTDLTRPHDWFLRARLDRRRIIFHGGPTNSGKTYSALQRLRQAKQGLYLGPLRLLAAEIYELLSSQGIYCNLLTGQEKRVVPFSTHSAATMEMAANMDEEFDVVVIDEIQMINDKQRGFAWTRALLSIRCKEIHVCGGLEARQIVERIAKACGDEFELHEYERFSELRVEPQSLASHPAQKGCYDNVKPGDCVVAFSRDDIFAIKREIEENTKFKCCVIYGSLPPETRTTQARLFNNPDSGYDILVASDAIGMGLNLNIRRIIFNSIFKSDGEGIVRLDHSAMKQISGRAGRRNSPFPEGLVTCRDPRDMEYLRRCLETAIEPVAKCGLIPMANHIELFGDALGKHIFQNDDKDQGQHLHRLLREFSEMAVLKGDYFLCRQSSIIAISDWLKDVDLKLADKYNMCLAPIPTRSEVAMDVLLRFAQKIAAGEVPGLPRRVNLQRARSFQDLARLCSIYNECEIFLWLQNKFPPYNLMEHQAALARRDQTGALINQGVAESDKLKLTHCYVMRDTSLRSIWAASQEDNQDPYTFAAKLDDDDGEEEEEDNDEEEDRPELASC